MTGNSRSWREVPGAYATSSLTLGFDTLCVLGAAGLGTELWEVEQHSALALGRDTAIVSGNTPRTERVQGQLGGGLGIPKEGSPQVSMGGFQVTRAWPSCDSP